MDSVLNRFPKKRPRLPHAVETIFNEFYSKNRSSSISQTLESWLHKSIKGRHEANKKTLEIGAGTLNHLNYENLDEKNYDIIEPKEFLFRKNKNLSKINKIYKNLSSCPNNFYERIISCAVLEHLTDLPQIIALSGLKITNSGYQSHSIPCEGYAMWNIPWFIFSGASFWYKYKQSFKHIANHEHINNFDEIIYICKYFYDIVNVKYSYPFYTKHLAFFSNIELRKPKINVIKNYLYK